MTYTKDYVLNCCAMTANMLDGMGIIPNTDKWNAVVSDGWQEGFLELTLKLGEYAMYCEDKLRQRDPPDFPGVYDYEVCCAFGEWFAEYLASTQDHPSDERAHEEIDMLTRLFFHEGPNKP